MLFDPRVIRWAVPTASEWLWKIGTPNPTDHVFSLMWYPKIHLKYPVFSWVWGLWTKIIPIFWVVYYWICHMKQGSLGVGTFSHQQGCSNLQFIARRLRKLVPFTFAYFCNLHPKPRWFRVLGAWATHQNAIGLWCCALIIFAGARAGFPGVREAPHGVSELVTRNTVFSWSQASKTSSFMLRMWKKYTMCTPPVMFVDL